MTNMTKSQRRRVAEVRRRDYYDVVCGTMNDDGTMTRTVRTASTWRERESATFTRRGRELA